MFTTSASGCTATGSNALSEPRMSPNVPSGSTRRLSRRIVWWHAAWSGSGRRRCESRRDLAEESDRFLKEQPPQIREDQRARILALSNDLPALWNAPETTAADRKEIIRLVVERGRGPCPGGQ